MRRAAIVGGGVIGGGWAARFALNGWDVTLFDPDPEAGRKLDEVLINARASLPTLYDRALPPEGRLIVASTLEDAVREAAWIQECVPERLALKHGVYRDIQRYARNDATLGSSTSGFKPSALQEGAARPAQILVCHPFNPVYLLPLVEVVPSPANDPSFVAHACSTLEQLGMRPLVVRKEIDAHLADRLLEAVWREALWLVNDEVATTADVDDAIRFGFGLRWAQMGLFETYRIAGGEAGMRHFLHQFGPALQWPWTKLMDVPALDDALIERIANQTDAQADGRSIRDAERLRDANLVDVLRALKRRDSGAGATIAAHEAQLPTSPLDPTTDRRQPLTTVERQVPQTWADDAGNLSESRYFEVFAQANDRVVALVGGASSSSPTRHGYVAVDSHVHHLRPVRGAERIFVLTRLLPSDTGQLHLFHQLRRDDGEVAATGEHLLQHVDLETRETSLPSAAIAANVQELVEGHAVLPVPFGVGRRVGQPG
ncbi:MAG: carnitine 3-dehydrogenase [Pseudomonadota bacterium]